MGELETREDVYDLSRGLTLLVTGGGGRPDVGLELLPTPHRGGRTLDWHSAESVDDDASTGIGGAASRPTAES